MTYLSRTIATLPSLNFLALLGVAAIIVATLIFPEPALAFGDAAAAIKTPTCRAFTVGRTILITGAVLAVIIGLAPMLWGEVKVKWIVSSLLVCVMFGVIPQIVRAFAGGVQGC